MLLVVFASAIIAIAAQIAIPIPFSPVPLTMQPLAVLLVGITLGSTRGAAAAALYLFEGFSGMPVFAQGHGGAMWLAGPTAGYLFSYPLAAWVAGRFPERDWGRHDRSRDARMLVALAVIYLGGWSWLATITSPPRSTRGRCDAVRPMRTSSKVALAAALLPSAQRLVGSLSR